jgi:hypothetical protein
MRLLYVAENVPNRGAAVGDGSSMIAYEVLQRLPADVSTTLLAFSGGAALPAEVEKTCEVVRLLPKRRAVLAKARSAVSRYDVGALERYTPTAVSLVQELSRHVDVTLLHGPHVLPLAQHVTGPLVLQTVDPWSLRARMDAGMVHGWRVLSRRHKSRQALALERALPARARLLTVGAEDAASWSRLLGRPVRNIPNGVEPVVRPARTPGPPVVCFVGSLNYPPNVESARTLVEEVAPRVWAALPATRFVIAGRKPTQEVLALAGDRVTVLANVPSVNDVFNSADVAVFPDRQGVGIRNSVREAVAAQLPVVASTLAAREQDSHPLLTVRAGMDEIAAAVIDVLEAAPDRVLPAVPVVAGERSWQDVTSDYLEELRAAAGDRSC